MVERTPPAGRAGAAAAAIAAAALAVIPFLTVREGTRLVPYRDVGGVMTVCTGETRVEMRRYSPAECSTMLRTAITRDYAPKVLACAPELANNRAAFDASIDAAYNAGPAAFCSSPMAAQFRARDWRAGCAAFIGWRATVKGRPVLGLANRRRDEAALCAKGSKA